MAIIMTALSISIWLIFVSMCTYNSEETVVVTSQPPHDMLNSSSSAVESTVHEEEQHQYQHQHLQQQQHGDTSAMASGLETRLEEAEMALQVLHRNSTTNLHQHTAQHSRACMHLKRSNALVRCTLFYSVCL
jgi:hypothetical protein